MTALTSSRLMDPSKTLRFPAMTLKSGQKVYANGLAAIELSSGKLVKGVSGNTGLKTIGIFTEDYDASATGANADILCVVDLVRDVPVVSFANDVSNPVTLVGATAYLKDDQTVSVDSSGNAVAGIVWAIDAIDGVLVEMLPGVTTSTTTSLVSILDADTADFTGNDWAPAAGDLVSGTTYVIGSTSGLAAGATLTLPAAGVAAGTTVYFAANGAQGAYAVTIRMGTTNISASLTASKRWMAKAVNVGDATTSIWVVDYTIDAN